MFCNSRACYERVVSSEDNGKTYDEVACSKHVSDMYKHSDKVAPKVMKLFMSSTGKLRRGEDISKDTKEFEEQKDDAKQ